MRKIKTKRILFIIATAAISSFSLVITSCGIFNPKVHGQDLMKDISSLKVVDKKADDIFISNTAIFSFELFKNTLNEDENSLLSPLSVTLALGMTANGANSNTLEQMQTVLGGDISLSDLNKYLYSYTKGLHSSAKSKLEIANSIWVFEGRGLLVEEEFLQKNADYYGAAAYKSAFDSKTLKDINNWVKSKTDGMIDKILEEISGDAVMYLINAIVFDAKWENAYTKQDISIGDFYAFDKHVQSVEFMKSEEKNYLEGDNFTGFIKPYFEDSYSFVALLPKENISVDELIQSIDGEDFLKIINEPSSKSVTAFLPKFTSDYKIKLNQTLELMGMPNAFDPVVADFSRMGKSADKNIYIEEVLHKTFISVDELGTKAGAVTKVSMNKMAFQETKNVKLNRPFLYSIIDNETCIPIFLGVLRKVNS